MLLFDENLSRTLVALLGARWPSATHVALEGLERRADAEIWSEAASRNLAIVTKDRDFEVLALSRGSPPKVIVIALGNCTTKQVAELMLDYAAVIDEFLTGEEALLLLG